MELPPGSARYVEECSPESERSISRSSLLLDRFREVDQLVERPPRDVSEVDLREAEGLHDHFMSVLAELPARDLDLACETYENLTDSDDPRDRYWAATFFPYMLEVHKPMGLSMLVRLIGREETEHVVLDKAWEQLSTYVAESDLLTFSEAMQFVDVYLMRYRERLLERVEHARGKKRDDHIQYDKYPPYRLLPTPGNAATEASE
jgi:hypothetical protein